MRTAIFVHSYCLKGGKKGKTPRLSAMAKEAMTTGVREMKRRGAEQIIVSAAYEEYWSSESVLQSDYARSEGVAPNSLHVLACATNSYDEAIRACALAQQLEVTKLIVIAERWHVSRSRKIFHYVCRRFYPGLELEFVSFRTPVYEVSLEPSMIKSLRSATPPTWILWNFLFGLLPPRWFIKCP